MKCPKCKTPMFERVMGGVKVLVCYTCGNVANMAGCVETLPCQLKQPTPTEVPETPTGSTQGTTERLRGIPEDVAGRPETAERLNAISERVHKAEWNKRGSKYGNVKTERNGLTFDSRKEADYYRELCLREAAGEITSLESQVKYPIEIEGKKVCTYVADFVYYNAEGRWVVVDVKGYRTPLYKLKKRMFEAFYGNKITEV